LSCRTTEKGKENVRTMKFHKEVASFQRTHNGLGFYCKHSSYKVCAEVAVAWDTQVRILDHNEHDDD
jgi:hypothetical protein